MVRQKIDWSPAKVAANFARQLLAPNYYNPLPTETGLAAANALAILLDGRAWGGAIRAEHAAIARFGLKPGAAADAVI